MADFAKSFWGHAFNTGVTFVAAWMLFLGTKVEVEPRYVEVLQEENRVLRSEVSQMQAKIVEFSIKTADMERIIAGGIGPLEESAVFAYVAKLGRPAWCKRAEIAENGAIIFRMAFINDAYEITYGMSADRYIGGTDFDNHSQAAAEHYYKNDLKTYESRGYAEFLEPVDKANRYGGGRKQFAKFWFRIPSGTEFVCGLQVGVLTAENPPE